MSNFFKILYIKLAVFLLILNKFNTNYKLFDSCVDESKFCESNYMFKEVFSEENRMLQSTPSITKSFTDLNCTDPNKYKIDNTALTIERNGNGGNNTEYYVMLNKYINTSNNIDQSVSYDLDVENLGDGLIFFGSCDVTGDTTKKMCRIVDPVMFNGLAIIYFGPDCFHFEGHVKSGYVSSIRNCLSEYTISDFTFKVNIEYSAIDKNIITTINFDGRKYFSSTNSPPVNPPPFPQKTYGCIMMFQDAAKVKISGYTP